MGVFLMCHSRTTLFNFFLNTKGSFGKAQRFCIILAVGEVLAWFQNYNFLSQCETSERRKVSCALPLSVALMTRTICKGLKGCAIARERGRAVCRRSGAQQQCGMKLSHKTKVSCCCRASVCGDDGVNHICCCERVWRLQGWAPLF